MTNIEIEKRLEILEAEIAVLKSKVENKDETRATPWWKESELLPMIRRTKKRCNSDVNIGKHREISRVKNDYSRHRLSEFA